MAAISAAARGGAPVTRGRGSALLWVSPSTNLFAARGCHSRPESPVLLSQPPKRPQPYASHPKKPKQGQNSPALLSCFSPTPTLPHLICCLWGTKSRCDVRCCQAERGLREALGASTRIVFWREGNQIWIIRAMGNSRATLTAVIDDHRGGKVCVPWPNSKGYENSSSFVYFPQILRCS